MDRENRHLNIDVEQLSKRSSKMPIVSTEYDVEKAENMNIVLRTLIKYYSLQSTTAHNLYEYKSLQDQLPRPQPAAQVISREPLIF